MSFTCGSVDFLTSVGANNKTSVVILGKGTSAYSQSIGSGIPSDLQRITSNPEPLIWDILATFLSISAVDLLADRSNSPDGWTRQLEVTIAVHNDVLFKPHEKLISSAASFLTGDIWNISFSHCASYRPAERIRRVPDPADSDCVALLSGGMDSLIGHIDLVARGLNPMAISHIYRGDQAVQRLFKREINFTGIHFITGQSEHFIHKPSPPSQRARSLTFLGLAIAGAGSFVWKKITGKKNETTTPAIKEKEEEVIIK